MIRYAIYDNFSDSYVGHKTSYYNHADELPEHMITPNYPAVGPEDAKLYTRKHDADRLLNYLSFFFDDYDRFELVEFMCSSIRNSKSAYYIMN